jgi:polysaccharide pyruvyl transferase WcaK-like protein
MTHILIANQHGENRGDEAAMRAMLASLKERLPDATFTLLFQFRDRDLRLEFSEPVEDLPIVLPILDYFRAAIYTLLKVLGLDMRGVLGPAMKKIVSGYDRADIVISAPGGPYFGDIYVNHELAHWWYVYLGHLFNKPIFLYATSAGPFNIKWMNPIRRWLYRKFDILVTREEYSAEHIRKLIGGECKVHVTADSALQRTFEPLSRQAYFAGDRAKLAERYLVAVSLNDYRYPDSDAPEKKKAAYDEAMFKLISHISEKLNAHFLLLPQLYGNVHCDAPYLSRIAQKFPPDVSWELVDSEFDSDFQQRLFAMCDFHLASRYHPAIFASAAGVPGICIYYEHKALGFMRQLGLEHYAFDINDVDTGALRSAMDEIIENREAISAKLRLAIPTMRQRSARTTDLALELLRSA